MNNFQFYSPTEFVFGKDTEGSEGSGNSVITKENGGLKRTALI